MLPAFAYHFGIRPWEVDLLTFGELDQFQQALVQLNGPTERGAARGRA